MTALVPFAMAVYVANTVFIDPRLDLDKCWNLPTLAYSQSHEPTLPKYLLLDKKGHYDRTCQDVSRNPVGAFGKKLDPIHPEVEGPAFDQVVLDKFQLSRKNVGISLFATGPIRALTSVYMCFDSNSHIFFP